jgi:endoribonuclease LACTB2
MKIIKTRYHSTNCYFINTGKGLLAFDAGWPDTYPEYRDTLKAEGYKIKDIRWLIVSHFHMDHAGLAGMIQDMGVELFIFPNQVDAINEMELLLERKKMAYHKVNKDKVIVLEFTDCRNWLKSIGIEGEILHTDGHADQCITLLLDNGEAFIGDLVPEFLADPNDLKTRNNWKLLRSRGAKMIYPAHVEEFLLDK